MPKKPVKWPPSVSGCYATLAYMEGWLDQQDAELPLFIAINMSGGNLSVFQHVKRWQDIISASRFPADASCWAG
ncbi:MAG: hypothetical protein IPM37_12575 [Hahellaceae bacterium]|nr:hypothetical protein [Hahellaceae bacterium]